MEKFYITTPIYYVNDEPHIGHAYTTILADVISRRNKLQGKDVYFLTGTDEHGQKVQEAAEKRNVNPLNHVNEYVKRFKSVWKNLDIDYNDFIRTTEKRHTDRVKDILLHLKEKGDIYMDEYEGLYSVSEERFITEKEAEEDNFKGIKVLKEKNYFFKMSKYQDDLINHIKSHPNFIKPESRKNEILGFLNKKLNDLCISRPKSRLSWGIELPFDSNYVSYVWFDALLNYITAIGWNSDNKKFSNYWPADYHLMGKDIITTHAVYWPTMLLACDIPLPKTIFAHGWWLMDENKMSKTTGNIIKPLDLADKYGTDSLRYFLMRNMVLGQDASYSFESFKERYNADLANDYGNLVNRIFILIKKNFNSKIPTPGNYDSIDLEIISNTKKLAIKIDQSFNNLKIHDAIEDTLNILRSINKFLELKQPWKTVKDNNEQKSESATTLYIAAELLRLSTCFLHPVMPSKSKAIIEALNECSLDEYDYDTSFGILKMGTEIKELNNIFPRID
tara:strand:- start:2143 stop:3657 length:1515 start_codon:yes stop_codon:yes gene_type:complete